MKKRGTFLCFAFYVYYLYYDALFHRLCTKG